MFRRSACRMALAPSAFIQSLNQRGCDAFYGVPDSLLKDLCAYVTDTSGPTKNIITANEGNAVAMAAGYHLASGKVPCVYMQNSGFGNTVNPLLSLTHNEVYKMPMLLVVGWRGDPAGKADEPQHVAQGRLMPECLASCEVPFGVVGPSDQQADLEKALDTAFTYIKENNTPYCLMVKRDTFSSYKMQQNDSSSRKGSPAPELTMGREEALEAIISRMSQDDIVVSTTGMPSREVFEIRARGNQGHHRDFLTVGCMGHCSSIAAGIALEKPDRTVYAIDGDGASLMHLGSYAVNAGIGMNHDVSSGKNLLDNLKHVVVNNGAHDSVGGQPTVGMDISLSGIARECGYNVVSEAAVDANSLNQGMTKLANSGSGKGPAFLEVLVKKGNRKDLGRPTTSPQQNKAAFMEFVAKK